MYIHIFTRQRHWFGKRSKKRHTAVNATCRGILSVCHRFASPDVAYSVGTGGFFPHSESDWGMKQTTWPLPSAKSWSCTSTLPYVIVVWYIIKIRDKFIFYNFIRCYFSSLWRLGFNPRPAQIGFTLDKVALEQLFSPSTSVFLHQYHSTNALCLFVDTFIYSFIYSFIHHQCCITLAAGIVNISDA